MEGQVNASQIRESVRLVNFVASLENGRLISHEAPKR